MNLPKGWKEVGHDWLDGPNGSQVNVRTNINETLWYASLRGPERATKEEAEADAEQMIWSLEPPPDREALARALYDAAPDSMPWPPNPWDEVSAASRTWWLSVADTAIRLCGGVREGKDAEPQEPLHITADRIAKEAADLRNELAHERLATRAAIDSRDLADKEVDALRDLLKKANEESAALQQQNRVLLDRNKFVETNLAAVHHDRDTQRAIVDTLRDIIVDMGRKG